MNFIFHDTEKVIDASNVIFNDVKHYVPTHNDQKLVQEGQNLVLKVNHRVWVNESTPRTIAPEV